jgi:hypothetical protein
MQFTQWAEGWTDMKKLMWGLLALAELLIAFMLVRPAVFNALKIAFTRKAVLEPNWAYFAGMLVGDLIRVMIACLLVYHAFRIVRNSIIKSALVDTSESF